MQRTTPGDVERKQRVLENGLEALRRLKGDQTFEDWTTLGEAMMVITEEAIAEAGVEEWDEDNRALAKVFVRMWEEYERRAASNEKPLTKQERWALRFLMTHPEVRNWRDALPGPDKRRLNHPNAVINKWKAKTQVRQPSGKPTLRDSVVNLSEENEALKVQVAELEAARTNPHDSEVAEKLRTAEIKIQGYESEVEELKGALKMASPSADLNFNTALQYLIGHAKQPDFGPTLIMASGVDPHELMKLANQLWAAAKSWKEKTVREELKKAKRRKQTEAQPESSSDQQFDEGLKAVEDGLNATLGGLLAGKAPKTKRGKARSG
jgi:hypothetical protein